MAGTTTTASGTPVSTPAASTPKTSESVLAKRIEASGLLTGEPPKPTQTRQKPAQTQQAPEDPDDFEEGRASVEDEADAGQDADDTDTDPAMEGEGTDEDPEGQAATAPSSELAQVRKELAELKALLAGGRGKDAPITGDAGGSQEPPAKSDKTADRLAKVKAKLIAAKGTDEKPGDWKELIEAIGLEEIVSDLESERADRAKEKDEARQAHEQREQQVKIDAANGLHKIINNIARADPEMTKILGIGRHGTLKDGHDKTRQRIFASAMRALQDSVEEYQSKQRAKPMTDSEALAIGIKRVTGKDVGTNSGAGGTGQPARTGTERQAFDRARMVRASSGGSTSKEKADESPQETESRLAANINSFFKNS